MNITEPEARSILCDVETRLDPANPAQSGLRVLAHGEISATLLLPGHSMAGLVAKRMSGFPNARSAGEYRELVIRYLELLTEAGVRPVETLVVVVPRKSRGPVGYLVQPQLRSETLGSNLLRDLPDDDLGAMIEVVLDQVRAVLEHSYPGEEYPGDDGGLEVAVDAQLSNWSFPTTGFRSPTLIDIGTPFIRERGIHALDTRTLLAAVPPGARSWYLWRKEGERYMDDYFDLRLVAVDLLGNFIKEDAVGRLAAGLAAVNSWLAEGGPSGLETVGAGKITEQEVRDYYRQDADTLQLFLRVRRTDRWVRTRLLRRQYDFILPGCVNR